MSYERWTIEASIEQRLLEEVVRVAVRLHICFDVWQQIQNRDTRGGEDAGDAQFVGSRFAPHLSRALIVLPLPEQRNSLDQ